jgi:tRNA G26 N,N-dimethylase Trm1
MLRSLQRLRGPLMTSTRLSNSFARNYSRTLNTTAFSRSLLQRNELCKPLLTSYQKHYFHTITPLFKEQEPDVNSKHQMLIGFTCKVCNERSHHTMSKHSYTKGVVLIQCPGCKNRHLIADNLGWFKDSRTTVEDLVKEKGEAIRKVIVDDAGIERLGDLMEWLPEITEEEKVKKDEAKVKAEELKKAQQQQQQKNEEQ